MTPSEVISSPAGVDYREVAISSVLFPQVNAVSAILMVVPSMVIAVVPVVVPLIMMVSGSRRYRCQDGDHGEKHGQCGETAHVSNLGYRDGTPPALGFHWFE
jgi:hypothetical protein